MRFHYPVLDSIAVPFEDQPVPILAAMLVIGLVLVMIMVIRNERK